MDKSKSKKRSHSRDSYSDEERRFRLFQDFQDFYHYKNRSRASSSSPYSSRSPSDRGGFSPPTSQLRHSPLPWDGQSGEPNVPTELELSEEVLHAMGDRPPEDQVSAPPLHSRVSAWWQEVAQAGLSQEVREFFIKKYPTPSNCCFLAPPKLNVEVHQALSESCRLRDQRIVKKQCRLVACLSSVAKTLSTLFLLEGVDFIPLIENLSDASRLLLDTVHEETMIRRSLAITNVNATMREMLSSAPIDEFLFGSKLSETIKLAKQINQNAAELKLPKAQPKPSPNAFAPQRTLANFKAPPAGGKSFAAQRPPYYRRQRQYRPRSRSPYYRRR